MRIIYSLPGRIIWISSVEHPSTQQSRMKLTLSIYIYASYCTMQTISVNLPHPINCPTSLYRNNINWISQCVIVALLRLPPFEDSARKHLAAFCQGREKTLPGNGTQSKPTKAAIPTNRRIAQRLDDILYVDEDTNETQTTAPIGK